MLSILKTKRSRLIVLAMCVILALSFGTVGALAAVNASRVKPENVREWQGEQGTVRMYINVDENGVPVDLTDEEWQEVNDLIGFRDENGNIIQPSGDENDLAITAVNPNE